MCLFLYDFQFTVQSSTQAAAAPASVVPGKSKCKDKKIIDEHKNDQKQDCCVNKRLLPSPVSAAPQMEERQILEQSPAPNAATGTSCKSMVQDSMHLIVQSHAGLPSLQAG